MPKTNKRQYSEESVESKPRGGYTEPTTVSDELKALLQGGVDSAWRDVLGVGGDAREQLFGGGNLTEGQAVSLKQKQAQEEEKAESKPQITGEFMEYKRTVVNAENDTETMMDRQVKDAVEEIRMEIKKLMQSSKLVERTVKDATADKAPVKPGKYHLNFFDFVLNVLKDATQKLEDSAAYGALFTSKKQQSHYWKMSSAQKGGTSFMLSGERSSATQTG